jgi:hypothetical protein
VKDKKKKETDGDGDGDGDKEKDKEKKKKQKEAKKEKENALCYSDENCEIQFFDLVSIVRFLSFSDDGRNKVKND